MADCGNHPGGRIKVGSVATVHGRVHRIVAAVSDEVLAIDVETHHVLLVQRSDGRVGLPRMEQLCAMAAPDASGVQRRAAERLTAELRLLDAAGVANGAKAIAVWLWRHWDAELRERYGEHDDPATIRRWRTRARRA